MIENQRLMLYVGLALVMYLMWAAWQDMYGPKPVSPPPPVAQSTGERAQTRTETEIADDIPDDIPDSPAAAAVTPEAPPAPDAEDAPLAGKHIRVFTDVFAIEIDTRGGSVVRADLLTYPVKVDEPDKPFRMFQDDARRRYVAQSGLRHAKTANADQDRDQLAPSHHAEFSVADTEYRLGDDADELEVPLIWRGANGVTVTKTYTFRRGKFVIDLAHEVSNGSDTPWTGSQYRQLRHSALRDDEGSYFLYTYTGGAYYDDKYDKIDFEEMADKPLATDIKGGWAAILQHYFVSALVPAAEETNFYYTKAVRGASGPEYIIGLRSAPVTAAPGGTARFDTRLFVGPKLQHDLEEIATGLDLVVDYGWLTALSKPLFWLLEKIHGVLGNWGWSIIVLTMLIKLAFYKLSETSYRSMAKMRKVQPRLVALKERFGEDKQRMQQELMKLYKKEKINPLGGCLPIAVQIPFFIALYWVLLESVELRQAPFVLWLNDLSIKDPYFVLPLIMGVSMFAQQKLNPAPLDPVQAKVMMMLPFVFTVFFAFFPAGLVLYWCVNNILSIAQQWTITRRIEAQATT